MGEPGRQEDRYKSPLEQVTGENDVHPEEERTAPRTERQGREAEQAGKAESAQEEGLQQPEL
ncbi:hypothetical protein QWM81_07850 [Streptomyces ficellus]|uniref:Uncharacterized protein n=1 Tax=Streptomyces ficellus TaxID=1977088 RepID=A0ABT7Z379_9ACTN|nr:hypothetical protein [Streptomyces ficellus]MDN3293960.1 hypothetical protein [Streptomyces ficellus]